MQELPDVTELYSFLLALHTGMNVNPRFVTPVSTPRGSLDGRPTSLINVHPMHRAQRKAGVFEETKEMRMYSTFNIPLIHGKSFCEKKVLDKMLQRSVSLCETFVLLTD